MKIDPQRRLNPIMQEAVHTEIVKFLDNGIIYPIYDSQWVSPVHTVSKKSSFIVVKNENKELVQTRLPTKIRVSINYRKLNAATRKGHFLLPFIEPNVWTFAVHEYYHFLDDYSGYNQFIITPEDQEKITFTCPFGTFPYRRMPFGLCTVPVMFQYCIHLNKEATPKRDPQRKLNPIMQEVVHTEIVKLLWDNLYHFW